MSGEEKDQEPLENPESENAADEQDVDTGPPAPEDSSQEAVAPGEAESGVEEDVEEEEEEEVEFDLEAQIEEFRRQIEEEPGNCIHYYNLGEALAEFGDASEARELFEQARVLDEDGSFSSIIHYGLGDLMYNQLMQGISSNVVKSSVGLISSHKDKVAITQVNEEDYKTPVEAFETAIRDLAKLKADPEILDHISKTAPGQIANIYYKWGSDLLDKARQLEEYGDEIKDTRTALKYLRKTLEIEPNHSAAQLSLNLGKKMLTEGWQSYDEYGFEAKSIPGQE